MRLSLRATALLSQTLRTPELRKDICVGIHKRAATFSRRTCSAYRSRAPSKSSGAGNKYSCSFFMTTPFPFMFWGAEKIAEKKKNVNIYRQRYDTGGTAPCSNSNYR